MWNPEPKGLFDNGEFVFLFLDKNSQLNMDSLERRVSVCIKANLILKSSNLPFIIGSTESVLLAPIVTWTCSKVMIEVQFINFFDLVTAEPWTMFKSSLSLHSLVPTAYENRQMDLLSEFIPEVGQLF